MPALPVLSWKQVVKALEKSGYRVARQRGSHLRLLNPSKTLFPVTVPKHSVIGRGLLRKIISDANLTVEEFLMLLRK